MNFPYPPTIPCAACLADPKRQAFGADHAMLAVHCPHDEAGAVYRPALGVWTAVSRISESAFAEYCSKLGALQMQMVAAQDGLAPQGKAN